MPNSYPSMLSMMGGGGASAPIPTQTFAASNIIGTPVPSVGDNKGMQDYRGAVGKISQQHVVVVAVAVIAIGYLVFHLNFEK